ncbi:hypothetical protein VNO77_42731 [Canavalia gladiata]|uniref:Transmembrane protein n=1 Tax=Canavalia gladiata TaxID=3824 RepID=A0AAN9JSV4_CANGL
MKMPSSFTLVLFLLLIMFTPPKLVESRLFPHKPHISYSHGGLPHFVPPAVYSSTFSRARPRPLLPSLKSFKPYFHLHP